MESKRNILFMGLGQKFLVTEHLTAGDPIRLVIGF